MKDQSVSKLTTLGLLAALIFVATYLLKIVLPIGYIHIGDGMILAGAVLLGPAVWLPAAIGSMLADIMLGFSAYALPTFLIKGIVGFSAGYLLKRTNRLVGVVGVFIAVEIIMVGGYFLTETIMYGFYGAIPQIVSNLIQGASGVVIGVVLYPVLVKMRHGLPYKS
ncbi:MAG: ECF transporter S component [Clostridium sp.]|nr:ECF transporter S component [Clostridium sp.]